MKFVHASSMSTNSLVEGKFWIKVSKYLNKWKKVKREKKGKTTTNRDQLSKKLTGVQK